jgi:hypothetical protein
MKKVGYGSMCLSSSHGGKPKIRRILVEAGLGKKQDPISKITSLKRGGGMAYVTEC